MYYVSTRNKMLSFTPAEAIAQGLSREGGLFVPQVFPRLPQNALNSLKNMSYQQRAIYIMGMYLEHFTSFELARATASAYSTEKFDTKAVAPVHKVDDNTYCLELWHGPTCAFKDMALQMLPHLLSLSLKKTAEKKTACILVATSGDTGKGALEGFKDVEQTKILVFYPRDGVSDIQKLQMQTQEGENVGVSAVIGNFDDAQTGVKKLFSDEALRAELAERGYFLSSANSINWGRVLPQIIYYISAYCDLLRDMEIVEGQKVNICVPTGNFGNILAAFYAKNMGLPVNKLICASNSNNVLTDFLQTGTYDRNRPFYTTVSPSMDILISSNLERLLYTLSEENDKLIETYMGQLNNEGRYTVNDTILKKIHRDFAAGCADEDSTKATIASMKQEHDYLIDTHTAVAFKVLDDYRKETEDDTVTIVASTASPFKFSDAVLSALDVETEETGLPLLDLLAETTGVEVPAPLASLKDKSVRFTSDCEKEAMKDVVNEFLK
ncbi:MAG: threonine synthase [Oscillospiraceae bacterium]|nr:threonine synthase [Oscillospiraceae bacterium]